MILPGFKPFLSMRGCRGRIRQGSDSDGDDEFDHLSAAVQPMTIQNAPLMRHTGWNWSS
jgi:hypothetical protein